jgi:hypothetical protein
MGVSVSDMVIRNILRFFLPATFVITVSDLLWESAALNRTYLCVLSK